MPKQISAFESGLIEDLDLDEFEATFFSANLYGLLQCMQRIIPAMKQQRSGAIVNFPAPR